MEREVNQINVIPLVDVMLVLLVMVLTVLERFVGVVDEVRGLGSRQVGLEVVRS